jgi:subtilisin family serine protease
VSRVTLLVLAASAALARPGIGDSSPHLVPGELLIKYRADVGAAARAALASELGAVTLHRFPFIGVEHVKLGGMTVEAALARLRRDPAVEYAEPNEELRSSATPDDPRFPELWGLHNIGQTGGTTGADIHAVQAWDVFTGDPDLEIGIIDSGIDYTHPDLAQNLWTNPGEIPGNGVDDDLNGYVDDVHGYDFVNGDGDPFDDNGHGTHVAGTIAAVGNNGVGVTGVCWRSRLVAIKFLDALGGGSTAGAIAALQYAVTVGARLTNNSWGGGSFSQALLDAIEAAGSAGELFIATVGKSGIDIDAFPTYPASYATPYIVAVTYSDADDNLGPNANYGATSVDLAAPGVDILSTLPGNQYGLLTGTSMATAYVTGVCALVMGRFPALGALAVKDRVMSTVDVRPGLMGRMVSNGRVNAFLAEVTAVDEPAGAGLSLGAAFPNPAVQNSTLAFELPRAGRARLEVFEGAGRRVAVLVAGVLTAGRHLVAWDGSDGAHLRSAPGIYWARLTFENQHATRAFVRIR